MGLSEVRRYGENSIKRQNGNNFYYYGQIRGYSGISFYVKDNVMERVEEMKGINERIGFLKIRIDNKTKISIIQVCVPTVAAEKEETGKFFGDLERTVQENREYYTIIMGDWNSKVGSKEIDGIVVGKFGWWEGNKRGRDLVEFAAKSNMKIANTFFKKKEEKKWTWISPDKKTKNEIDHLLVNYMTIIKDVVVMCNFRFLSDHKPVRCSTNILPRAQYRNNILKN